MELCLRRTIRLEGVRWCKVYLTKSVWLMLFREINRCLFLELYKSQCTLQEKLQRLLMEILGECMFKNWQDSGRKCHHSFHNTLSNHNIGTRATKTGYRLLHSYKEHRSAQNYYRKQTVQHKLHSCHQKKKNTNYTRITNTEQHTSSTAHYEWRSIHAFTTRQLENMYVFPTQKAIWAHYV